MPDFIGSVTDRDGDRITVEVDGGDVYVTANASTHCVALDEKQQEEFAQYFVAACHEAKAHAEAARKEAREEALDAALEAAGRLDAASPL